MPQALRAGDVLLTSEAPMGLVAQVTDDEPLVLGQRLFALRGDPSKIENGYLTALLRWQPVQDRLLARSSGSTVVGIKQSELLQVVVPVRPLVEQQAIVQVLMTVDIARSAGAAVAAATVASARALLDQAGSDARRSLLSSVATIRKGLSYKGSGLADAGKPMANLANAARFGGFKRDGFKHYTGAYQARHVAHGGDLLVANTDLTWKLEALGYPMLLPGDVPEALFSHHVSIVDFAPEHAYLRLPVWAHLFTRDARLRIESMAHGTTVAAIPPDALTGMEVRVLEAGHPVIGQAEALLQRAWAAERESIALANLRDALLPGLMSGQLKVRDAEDAVSEVV